MSKKIFGPQKTTVRTVSGQLGAKNHFQLSGQSFFLTFEIRFEKNWIFFKKKQNWMKKWGFCLVRSLKNHVFHFSNEEHTHLHVFWPLFSNFKNAIFGQLSGQCPDSCQNTGPKVLLVQRLHHYKVQILSYNHVPTMFFVPLDPRNTFRLFLKAFKTFKFNFVSRYSPVRGRFFFWVEFFLF